MTTGSINLELEPRELLGKKVSRLRKEGIIPVHLYGSGVESRSLQCQAQALIQVLSAAGGSTPINITISGEKGAHLAFAREIQWDPKRDDIIHVDLLTDKPLARTVLSVGRFSWANETPMPRAASYRFKPTD